MSNTLEQLHKQRAELRVQVREKMDQVRSISAQIERVELEIQHLNYPCQCVQPNKQLGISNMIEQEQQHRNPLDLGAVCDVLSADKDCPICHGSGVPGVSYD
jgi:hypothetical protein